MILICEPQCTGMEHSEVNTGLLLAYLTGFPSEKIVFFSEAKHMELVKERLAEKAAESFSRVDFKPLDVPVRNHSSLQRFCQERKVIKEIREFAKKHSPRQIVFFSVTAPGLLLVKFLIMKFPEIPFSVIMHGIFHTIVKKLPVFRIGEFLFFFRWIFLLGNKKNLFYIALAPSAKKEIALLFPNLQDRIYDIHLPYFFESPREKKLNSESVYFAYFGAVGGGKQADLYFETAKRLKKKWREKLEFPLIGYISNSRLQEEVKDFILLYSNGRPLTREEYILHAEKADYVLFFYDSSKYRFLTSGAFFDALSYGKPMICLKNALFESYFQLLGNIGYLCENQEEIESLIESILTNPSPAEYEKQQRNIYQNRAKITIEESAVTLREFYENWRGKE